MIKSTLNPKPKICDRIGCELYNASAEERAAFFTGLDNDCQTLLLRGNKLYQIPSTELAVYCFSIPASIQQVDISCNQFCQISAEDLASCLASFPVSVEHITLSNSDVIHRTEQELAHIRQSMRDGLVLRFVNEKGQTVANPLAPRAHPVVSSGLFGLKNTGNMPATKHDNTKILGIHTVYDNYFSPSSTVR